jgi:hypothetical protein
MNILTNESEKAIQPNDINITLKNHQLAMLKRCIDIESDNNNKLGIMRDKPGTGKTYVLLSIIYNSIYAVNEHELNQYNNSLNTNKKTIIIVPQNIYSQWILAIETYCSKLTYQKFITYDNIANLYYNSKSLYKSDIIITTTLYYDIIAKTCDTLNIIIDRVIFDEIDSISNMVQTKINARFIWFVSASFNIDNLGYYTKYLKQIEESIHQITCICDSDFIDQNIELPEPTKNYYLCKNIYIDNILDNIISQDEMNRFNALDFTLDVKKAEKKSVLNEKDAIDLIIKNNKINIDVDTKTIDENMKLIDTFKNYYSNFEIHKEEYMSDLAHIHKIIDFKKYLLDFINDFKNYTNFYLELELDDKNHEKLIRIIKNDELQTLRSNLQSIIELLYNFNNIEKCCREFLENRVYDTKVENIFNQINQICITLKLIYELLEKINDRNKLNITINTEFDTFFNIFNENKEYIINFYKHIIDFNNACKANNQLDILIKNTDLLKESIQLNKIKIDLLYSRLKENDCCPVCYRLFDIINKSIYITSQCCNNKICSECIEEWFNKYNKNNCIFCNKDEIYINNLISYETNNIDIISNVENDENIENVKNLEKENNKELKSNSYEIDNASNNLTHLSISKYDFLEKYIIDLEHQNKKVIIFSDYSNIFKRIEDICINHNVLYTDLDKGNIQDIDKSVNEYKFGNAKILLSNSNLFGCGMNFENSDEILFVHMMTPEMEKQVIGRAQRLGRKKSLNIIYLQYQNESAFCDKKVYSESNNYETNYDDLFQIQQTNILMQSVSNLDLQFSDVNIINNESNINELNELSELNTNKTSYDEHKYTSLESISNVDYNDYLDVNLEELISSLY